jgi:integrase
MVAQLGPRGQRDWFLLGAVAEGKLSLTELYEAFQDGKEGLEALRRRLQGEINDPDVEPYVAKWLQWVQSHVDADTRDRYDRYVRSLIPVGQPFRRSMLTAERIMDWHSSLTYEVRRRDRKAERKLKDARKAARERGEQVGTDPLGPVYTVAAKTASSGTQRKYWAGLASFCGYLVTIGVLPKNVAHDVEAPPQGDPRCEYLSLARVRALVAAQPEPYKTLSMLLHATGMEVSAALRATKRHFSFGDRSIRGLGTKWKTRDRITYIAEWAWHYIRRHVAGLEPDALLFPGLDRWRTLEAHKAACKALSITNYTQHDARHSYAVHAVRCGASFEHVAEQLGHADTQMAIRVYARFTPSARERMAWESRSQEIERLELAEERQTRGPERPSGSARRRSKSPGSVRKRRAGPGRPGR